MRTRWIMMGITILLGLAFIGIYPARAFAAIPSTVTGTFTVAAGETVAVTNDIQIASGGHLVIEPGAVLVFEELTNPTQIFGIYIQPGGELTIGALGAGQTAILRPRKAETLNPPERYTGWQGIKNEGGTLTIFNAKLQMANLAVWSVSGTTVIDRSTFEYCHGFGVRAEGGSLRVTNTLFNDNGDALYLNNFKSQTAQICGNQFTGNNRSVALEGENYLNLRSNTFTDANATTIYLLENSINGHVSISCNNFYHNRTGYDPDNLLFFYIVHNQGSPVGIYDCYWSNLGTLYGTVSQIVNANLIGPPDQLNNISVISPETVPYNVSAADTTPPELIELSPVKALPGKIGLNVVIHDVGWGVDPKSVSFTVGGNPVQGISYTYTNRQYLFTGTVTLPEGSYSWSIQASDVAGNGMVDPRQVQNTLLTVSSNLSAAAPPLTWQSWDTGIYRLITVPVAPYLQDHYAVLGLDAPGTSIVRWQEGRYLYYGDPELEQFAPGKGYWLRLGEGDQLKTATINGNLQLQNLQVVLTEGWHLIGSPFDSALSFKRITFLYDKAGSTVKEHSYLEAVMDGYIGYGVWGYSHPNYVCEREQLAAWEGYWIRVKKACSILYRTTDYTYTTQSLIDWEVQITASQNANRDSANYFGSARMALAGEDVYDLEKPPAFQSTIKSYFAPKGAASAYAADYRPLSSANQVWEYRVTGLSPGSAVVQWGNLTGIPSSYRLTLKDPVSGKEIDMRRTSSYNFTVGAETERKFDIVAAEIGNTAVQIFNVRLSNNPFAPQRESLQISFDLNNDVTLEVRIYDWVGNLVCVFPTRVYMSGTDYVIQWDGRNNRGRMVANGIYFCKMTARNGSSRNSQVLKIAVVN